MQKLNHPNIIKYIDSFLDGNTLAIIMEFAEGGDLNRVLILISTYFFKVN